MGKPAARLGDTTGHGAPLTGVPNAAGRVLIGKKPAWCMGDMHLCPLANGPQPHGPGNLATASATVFICGMPAARQGDLLVDGGGPYPIALGEPTVLIGG
jgi:uncharacterized Zn-binding protein involved in type VI secretion